MLLRNLRTVISGLSPRERVFAGLATGIVLVFLVIEGFSWVQNQVDKKHDEIRVRTAELQNVQRAASRFQQLNERFTRIKATFAEAEMSVDEVYQELEGIIKRAIDSQSFELKDSGAKEEIGLDYEKQEFRVTIRSITLDEFVKLLFELDQSDRPLFLRTVEITSRTRGNFTATLNVFSVLRRAA